MPTYEQVTCDESILETLETRFVNGTPKNINIHEHPLLPYISPDLFPKEPLNVFILEDSQGFYYKAMNPGPFFSGVWHGGYLAKDHPWAAESYGFFQELLQKEYNLELPPKAILLSKEHLRYETLIHEILHDVFTSLSSEAVQKLTAIVEEHAPTASEKHDLEYYACTQLKFEDYIEGIHKLHEKNGRLFGDRAKYITFSYKNLKPTAKIQLVDELITHLYFPDPSVKLRMDRTPFLHLFPSLKSELTSMGYHFPGIVPKITSKIVPEKVSTTDPLKIYLQSKCK